MKKALLVLVCLAAFAGIASAQEITGLDLHFRGSFDANTAKTIGPLSAAVNTTAYDNITNFLGQGLANGGAALSAGNTITRMVCDDITPAGVYTGLNVNLLTFSVANFNAASTTARARVRFYASDGVSGGPGTIIAAFSFNPIAFPTGVSLWNFNPAGTMLMPAGSFWAGITFDNNTGTTGATAATLNNLGQGLFDPPAIGSSLDLFFRTTAAGSFAAANPAGSFFNLGANPNANMGWAFDVEAPVPAVPSTWGRVKSLFR